MKNYFKVLILTIICLAILIPFASEFPDGLETVAEALNIEEHEPAWKGLMPDYTIPAIENPYISTFAAGVIGTLLVFFATFTLGTTIAELKNKEKTQNPP